MRSVQGELNLISVMGRGIFALYSPRLSRLSWTFSDPPLYTIDMAIDDPREQIEQQFPVSNPELRAMIQKAFLAGEIVTALTGLPLLSAIFKGIRTLRDMHFSAEQGQKMGLLMDALWVELARLESLQSEFVTQKAFDDFAEAIFLALRQQAEAFESRPGWYATVLAEAAQYGKEIPELTNFIRDLERLNDQDIAALKVLNKVQNPKGLFSQRHSGGDEPRRAEPTAWLNNRDKLSNELMLGVFGIDASNFRQDYSREDIYVICLRLQAYGLAVMFDDEMRTVPFGKFVCRPSKSGLMLLKLMGESVENWERWFAKVTEEPTPTTFDGRLKVNDRVRVKQSDGSLGEEHIMISVDYEKDRGVAIPIKRFEEPGGSTSGPLSAFVPVK
jgi:hypothetical protein